MLSQLDHVEGGKDIEIANHLALPGCWVILHYDI